MDCVQYVGNILRTKRYVIYVEIVTLCSSQNTWIKKDNMCLQPYGFILEHRHLYSESIGVLNSVWNTVICTVNLLVC